jgi:hypothetical protein
MENHELQNDDRNYLVISWVKVTVRVRVRVRVGVRI